MRADRLLSMLWLLQSHGGMTTTELAERLEVSRRTVLRDVEALSTAGVPVHCERGPRGGVRLLPGYRTNVTALNQQEHRAIFAALSPWGAEAIGLGTAFQSGMRKLLAAVPEFHRSHAMETAARIVVDPQGWLPQPAALRLGDTFQVIREAVFARLRLELTYRSRRAGVTHVLEADPHGLVSAGDDWYVCVGSGNQVRFLKVARVEKAALLDEPCERDDVDVAAAWRDSRDHFCRQFIPVSVTAWLRGERRQEAGEWVIGIREAALSGTDPEIGWDLVHLEFMDHVHAITVLLRLGPDVRVESPAEIKDELVRHVEQIVQLYRG